MRKYSGEKEPALLPTILDYRVTMGPSPRLLMSGLFLNSLIYKAFGGMARRQNA